MFKIRNSKLIDKIGRHQIWVDKSKEYQRNKKRYKEKV